MESSTLTRDEQIRGGEAQREVLRRLAPTSLEAHARLLHRDDASQPIIAAEHHAEWIRIMENRDQFPWVVVVAPPGFAKALEDETPILTPNGWRRHGDLRAGDQVFAPDGQAVEVRGAKRWAPLRPCMRVDFSDGTSIVADERHDWQVLCDREHHRPVGRRVGPRGAVRYVPGSRPHSRIEEIVETRHLLEDQRRPPAIPVCEPLDLRHRYLQIEPYLLGCWLGDGTSSSGKITIGSQDLDHFASLGEVHRYPSSTAATIQVEGLTTGLRLAGLLNAKHIPIEYLLSSFDQRLALLQGLMDTDGTIAPSGHASYCSTSELLARQVRQLVCSLGMKASFYIGDAALNGQVVSASYRVAFHPHLPVFRLPRKAARCKSEVSERTKRRFVTGIERIGERPAQCITVDGGLYLAGEGLIPTHNSSWHSWIYPTWRLGQDPTLRFGIVGNSSSQAASWTAAISDSVDAGPFQKTYRSEAHRPNKRRGWSRSYFYLNGTPKGNSPAALASGVGGVSVLGKRFDEIVLDDPTTWDNARSQTTMDGQRTFLKSTLVKRFPPGMGPPEGDGGRMIAVLTRWSEQDLVPIMEELGFQVVRMPALGYLDRVVSCETCHFEGPAREHNCPVETATLPVIEYGEQSLWPERVSEAQLLAEQVEDPLIFDLVMQGDASAMAGDFFDPQWFQGRIPPERDAFEKVVQFVDTAGGKDRKKGDYTVILTLGRIGDEFQVLAVKRDRLSALRQEDAVKSEAARWNPDIVTIEEKNEGIALLQRLAVNTNLPLKGYVPVKDKEFRATGIAAKYRAGHVFHEADSKGTSPRWVRSLEAELKAFPDSRHDDQVDALSGAFNSMTAGRPRVRVLG